MLTRLPTSCAPKVTAYNKLELLHKKMMSLHCSSIQSQTFIPVKKHEGVLKLIHEGHLGLNKCKLHAKETV